MYSIDEIRQIDFSLKAPLGKYIVVQRNMNGRYEDIILGIVDTMEEGFAVAEPLNESAANNQYTGYLVIDWAGTIMCIEHLENFRDPDWIDSLLNC